MNKNNSKKITEQNNYVTKDIITELIANQKIVVNSISELNAKIDNVYQYINTNLNDSNNNMSINFVEIKKSILNNNNLINSESNKQIEEIKNLNEIINNNQDLINAKSNKQIEEIKNLNET